MRMIPGILFASTLLGLLVVNMVEVDAQGAGEWSAPVMLSEEGVRASAPEVAVDKAGRIHVVWTSGGPSSLADDRLFLPLIEYTVWDGTAWSTPVDIIAHDQSQLFPRLLVDSTGRLHLFWRGDCLNYNWSLDIVPDSARKWSQPAQCLADPPIVTRFGAAIGDDDALYLAFPVENGTLLFMKSPNAGASWEDPVVIADANVAPARYAANPDLAVDGNGYMHVVWLETPVEAYPALGLYYSRSTDGGSTWSSPIELDGARAAEARIVVANDGKAIHVVWNGDVSINSRFHRWSPDGGETWLATEEIVKAPGGYLGAPAAVFDSAGTLHVLAPTDVGLFYTSWNGRSWAEPLELLPDKQLYPVLSVTEGNQLHAFWGKNVVRYMTLMTSAPSTVPLRLSALGMANLPDVPTPIVTPRPSPTPSPTAVLALGSAALDRGTANPGANWTPLILGTLPAMLLVAGVVLVYLTRRRHGWVQ